MKLHNALIAYSLLPMPAYTLEALITERMQMNPEAIGWSNWVCSDLPAHPAFDQLFELLAQHGRPTRTFYTGETDAHICGQDVPQLFISLDDVSAALWDATPRVNEDERTDAVLSQQAAEGCVWVRVALSEPLAQYVQQVAAALATA